MLRWTRLGTQYHCMAELAKITIKTSEGDIVIDNPLLFLTRIQLILHLIQLHWCLSGHFAPDVCSSVIKAGGFKQRTFC